MLAVNLHSDHRKVHSAFVGKVYETGNFDDVPHDFQPAREFVTIHTKPSIIRRSSNNQLCFFRPSAYAMPVGKNLRNKKETFNSRLFG
jgi:hypothetical protein